MTPPAATAPAAAAPVGKPAALPYSQYVHPDRSFGFRYPTGWTPKAQVGQKDGIPIIVIQVQRQVGSAVAGVAPGVMGYGPVPATQKLFKRLELSLDDVGLVELNEAFAAQAIGVMRRLGLNHAITNVNGGAIALGHPTGCSGARILTTLLHEMKRRASQEQRPYYGLATLCVGVGMGGSTIVEWLD